MAGGGATESDQASSRFSMPEPRRPGDVRRSQQRDEDVTPDAVLLQRHVDGDTDAFGQLFARHRDRLWAVAIRTLGDPEEAADALQDAMIAAFRRAASFRGDSAVTTWLHRIVVNAALDRMRRRAARPTTAGQDDEALDALAVAGGQPLSDPSGTTDTAMDVMAALRQLVPDQRAALVLVDMLGYSISDAAEVLGVSEGTVKSRAARGRARLLPRLAHLRPGSVPSQDTGNRAASQRVQPAQEGGDDAL
jgi:RNA polymerase sigma-70 factor, ECF subfamily